MEFQSNSCHENREDIWILRDSLNDLDKSFNNYESKYDNYKKLSSSLNRKTNKFVHYAPFLFEEINTNQKNFKSKQELSNSQLQSILRVSYPSCTSQSSLNSESVWIKQASDQNFIENKTEYSSDFDNILSQKLFYLDDTYSNILDFAKDENSKMKKSKQQQNQITNILNQTQDKSNIRSSSLVVNAKAKINKKVDFLDIKLNNCLNKNKKIIENNSLPSSSQSSPKSTLSNQNTHEDSFVDSNLSSSSSDVLQSGKGSNQKITALSSISSTSSGVGSSNVSSASSTTSETPSTENLPNSKAKIAPKAIISDDGDIEIETPNKHTKLKKPERFETNRLSMRIIDQNVYKNDQRKYNNVYYVNAKNNVGFPNVYSQKLPKQTMCNQNQYYQNQLAAAAAAAAAMDKEKQRDALIEYVKSQQLQEQHKYNHKLEMPHESFKNLNKQIGLETSCQMKNERPSNLKNFQPINSVNYQPAIIKTPARRDSCLGRLSKKKHPDSTGLCYLIYGPETKRTLLPSQVTGIDTVKALFVRAFSDKLTMSYLDDEKSVKIYIKDQLKDLFYQLDDMSDIKDKCVLKLVEISKPTNGNQQVQQVNQSQNFNGFESSQLNNPMTQSQYCYSSLSEHQSIPAQFETKNPETISLSHRSLSEPRNQAKKSQMQKQVFQNPIYNQQSQDYFLTNQDAFNQSLNSTVETYDNLDAQSAHHSRIESKFAAPNTNQQFNFYDRYNRSMNPIYNSMRVGSRDVKSVDRDVLYSYQKAPPTPRKLPSDVSSAQISRQSTINESTFDSPSKIKNICDIDATEDDTISLPSSISVRAFKTFRHDLNKNLDSTEYDAELDDDDKTVNEEHTDVLDSENFEESKMKMKLMQKQLETLTNLVHQALINKDLNRLEGIAQSAKLNQNRFIRTNSINNKTSLNSINDQTKKLKNDLFAIKKMHENFNSIVGDSLKEFVKQINDKIRVCCLNEESESLRINNLMNKYNTDFAKIENELCDLETVVDDLRENILKHKLKVNIDDVECYALALSQLSKQLVNLKTSFSSIKEHFKQNSINTDNRLAILPRGTNKKAHNPPGLPPAPRQKPNDPENGLNYIQKDFINDIQSIKPDHEQRKLAIEVDDAFNQLMSEISMIAHDINPTKLYKNCLTIERYTIDTESDSDSVKSKNEKTESESTIKKRSKFRSQKNQLKEERDSSVNNSLSSNSSFSSTPSSPTYHSNTSSPLPIINSHMNGINIQTMPIPLAVPINPQFHQNKSFLETVHEEEPNLTVDLEAKEKKDFDFQQQCDEEILNSVENELYEQLSEFRPVKAKNYKTSTSICLVNPEMSENENQNVSTSIVITPNNQINEENQTASAYLNISNNKKLNVRFSDPGQNKSAKSKIITNGSMQRVTAIKSETNDIESGSSTKSISPDKLTNDKISTSNIELNLNGNKSSSISLVPKRNSDNTSKLMSSSVTLDSSSASSSSSLNTPRRVSLSVTDL